MDITVILNNTLVVAGATDITGRLVVLGEAVTMLQEDIMDSQVDILVILRVRLEEWVAITPPVLEV